MILYILGFILLVVSLFQGFWSSEKIPFYTTNRIDIFLGAEVIQHLLKLPQRYFDKRPVGELQTRLAELGNIQVFDREFVDSPLIRFFTYIA